MAHLLNVVEIPLSVDIANNQPTLHSVSPAGALGKMTLRWTLGTTNSPNGDIATFNSQDGTRGIAFQDPLPDGITIPSSTGNEDGTTWHAEIHSTLSAGSPNQTLTYVVNYLFQGQSFSDDPVIVVTPEPVSSGTDVGLVSEQPRHLRLAKAV